MDPWFGVFTEDGFVGSESLSDLKAEEKNPDGFSHVIYRPHESGLFSWRGIKCSNYE